MENKISASEKQRVYDELEREQEKLHRQGKIIVFVIAAVNVLMAILNAMIEFSFLTLVIQIGLSIALFKGVSWVRYLFVLSAGWSSFVALVAFFGYLGSDTIHIGILLFLGITLAFYVTACVMLFVSKSVAEFLYAQKNG